MEIRRGSIVYEVVYNYRGIVEEVYDNWEELKVKNEFASMRGQPKDNWLKTQHVKFIEAQLEERWFSIRLDNGQKAWSCESRLKLDKVILN